jgi:hypothetical protein
VDSFAVFYGRAYRQRLEVRNSKLWYCGDVRAVPMALNTAQVAPKQELPCFTKQIPSAGFHEIKGLHMNEPTRNQNPIRERSCFGIPQHAFDLNIAYFASQVPYDSRLVGGLQL